MTQTTFIALSAKFGICVKNLQTFVILCELKKCRKKAILEQKVLD